MRPGRSARSSSRRSTSMAGSCAPPCASGSSPSTRGVSVASPSSIGVASGESKVRPILGALRAGVVRTLVTDVATAEAVVALDDAGAAMNRPPAVLGLDLGTTEVKAGLVDLDGRLLGLARAGYGLDVSGGRGWAEQDPGAWWSAVISAVRALRAEDLADVVAIGVDGHGPTLVAGRRPRRGDTSGDHLPRHARHGRGGRARRARPASAAGRSAACRPRSGSSATSPTAPPPPAGTSRPGSGSRSG